MAAEKETEETKGTRKDTRLRVLESACLVFAEKGFHDATVHEICDRAGANIAAVNYYFRDKESLYREAWEYAAEAAREEYGVRSDVSSDLPPEEQLYQLVLARLQCIFDDGLAGCFPRLMARELLKPSPALEDIVMRVLHPLMHGIADLIAKLLGPGATDHQIHGCTISVVAQFAHVNFTRPIREVMRRLREEKHQGHEHPTLEQMARHMTDFSLAGIRYYREQNAKRRPNDDPSG